MKTIAIIADIHANSLALEAVLEDIEKINATTIINLGDSLYGPLEPKETYAMIKNAGMISISGNMDRYLREPGLLADNLTMQYVLGELDHDAKNWLEELPFSIQHNGSIFGCHGTPFSDEEPMLEHIQAEEVTMKTNHDLSILLKGIQENIILCAHTHVPRIQHIVNGKVIINPGSVGLPSYTDNLPHFHKMESGSPHAKYCVVETADDGSATYTHRQIKYDWVRASNKARSLGREDWAHSLLYGLE